MEIIQQVYKILMQNHTDHSVILIPYIREWSPQDFENLVKSAQGSKLMQDVLKKFGNKDLVGAIYQKLVLHESKDVIYRLMTNKYANYFIQLFVSKAEEDQKSEII